MALQLTTFKTADDAAQALALQVSKDLHQVLAQEQERALLLVSGGRSPLPFFAALAQQPLAWENIDISLVDERSVRPDHPDANAALVREHLLCGPAAAARFLPLMSHVAAATDPWLWARRSVQVANANPALVKPAVIVLGLGTDGHTASLFADAPQWHEATTTERRYVALQPGQAPHARVSLSLHALAAQHACYVWSGGAAKLEVLRRASTLAAAVADGSLDAATLDGAGAIARLVADPGVILKVYHSQF
ncbi:6-phosphogluconolactonase [Janthinobacterium sp. 17J80-10]|uniref:6-phosphogluconolactonase n=1 Tax=Janthinobacterium sp. 17J80-10 TaxID=2497863 RepID=UPI0013E8B224|nr:6-phosphogluconolactonase [Janthinobacterium sp. 17J80-10]